MTNETLEDLIKRGNYFLNKNDYDSAYYNFSLALEYGSTKAMLGLAKIYLMDDENEVISEFDCKKYLEKAAKENDVEAQEELGFFLLDSDKYKNEAEGVYWIIKSNQYKNCIKQINEIISKMFESAYNCNHIDNIFKTLSYFYIYRNNLYKTNLIYLLGEYTQDLFEKINDIVFEKYSYEDAIKLLSQYKYYKFVNNLIKNLNAKYSVSLLKKFNNINDFNYIKEKIEQYAPNEPFYLQELYIQMARSYKYGFNNAYIDYFKAIEFYKLSNCNTYVYELDECYYAIGEEFLKMAKYSDAIIYYSMINYYRPDVVKERIERCEIALGIKKESSIVIGNVVETRKRQIDNIRQYFYDRGIKYLIHFTDASNLPLIKKEGLLSRQFLENKKFNFSYNDPNRFDNLLDYICLSITKPNPYLIKRFINNGKLKNPVILYIKIDALFDQDTNFLFSDINAASSIANIGFGIDDLKKLFVDSICYTTFSGNYFSYNRKIDRTRDNETTDPQAEVLVKRHIDIKYIELERIEYYHGY